jgi:hypothetical protein
MNNSLDKLIGNDELLTYICLILGIFNTFLMSIVITGIKHSFSIYIFLLFEAIFLIFIVYFILKKKDVYSKDDDIKYDWYFYLRISIITLVFFNFFLYIYNITNDSSTNPRKNGGGGTLSSLVGSSSRSNRVAPAAPAAPTNIENEIKIKMLQEELEPLVKEYTKYHDILKSSMQYPDNKRIKENIELAAKIAPLRVEIDKINEKINKLGRTGASRASSRAPRAASREASNRVVNDPFPYQTADSNYKSKRSDISDIMRDTNLTALQKTTLWGKLEKEERRKKEKMLKK